MHVSQELYPFKGRYLDIGGHQLHTIDEGKGSPVVMVHGNPSWSFYYRNLAASLSHQHRVIVPDHIGCGFSDKPSLEDYPYTLERRVSDFTELMKRLDLGKDITLVVHDWGGMIGLAWAVEHAAQVKRIVLLNTGAFPLPESKKMPWTLSLVRNTKVGEWLVLGFNAFSRGATKMAVTRNPMPPEIRDAYCAPYDSVENRIATLRFVQDIPLSPSDPSWSMVEKTAEKLSVFKETPVLVCWGAKDFVFDDHFLAEWESRWPHAVVHRFEDCGHYILEDASEEVISRVRDFIQTHPVPAETR
ncbi:MAG: alpha/beta fold hydrolase [Planctomycetota bacterium]|jgi:haloalkane dehalogenase|nr:alpha/beta fold hydrolase [Planctomycetota bacterium]